MARRVSLPSADDIFRPTEEASAPATRNGTAPEEKRTDEPGDRSASRRSSGRVRHDEKVTVYVTSEELLEIEHARLALRSLHGLAVDRGRLVREAVALVLADLEAHGSGSALVRRLRQG